MIFFTQVKWTAENHLRYVLSEYPAQLRQVLKEENFNKFCNLMAERLNQLDIAGYIGGKFGFDEFVKCGATLFAKNELAKSGDRMPDDEPPKDAA